MRIEAMLANADNATKRTGEALEVAFFKLRYPWVWNQVWKHSLNTSHKLRTVKSGVLWIYLGQRL